MTLTPVFSTREDFVAVWPESASSIIRLHEPDLHAGDPLSNSKRMALDLAVVDPDIELIGAVVNAAWSLDQRFFGEVARRGKRDFEAAVYMLVYICRDPQLIDTALKAFVPFMGSFSRSAWPARFQQMLCATFCECAEVLVWEIQGAEHVDRCEYFDWHGQLNQLTPYERQMRLSFAGLSPLVDPNVPPLTLMQAICFGFPAGLTEDEYAQELKEFYVRKGHVGFVT